MADEADDIIPEPVCNYQPLEGSRFITIYPLTRSDFFVITFQLPRTFIFFAGRESRIRFFVLLGLYDPVAPRVLREETDPTMELSILKLS
ncbi:MAG: hypothetical protein WAV20_24420 [Blastocatellia bacterium]